MKKNKYYYVLVISIFVVLLCSCNISEEYNFKENENYCEADIINEELNNDKITMLMFEQNLNNKNEGILYLNNNGDKEIVSENVINKQYAFIGNNNIIYIKNDNNLYLKQYKGESKKILDNVELYSIKYSQCGGAVASQFYKEGDSSYIKDFYINSSGETIELYDTKGNNSKDYNSINEYIRFLSNNKMFLIGNFDTLIKLENNKIEKLASNVYDFDVTGDGNAYAYVTYNDSLFINWGGSNESRYIDKNVFKLNAIAENGLSCIYTAYSNDSEEESSLMFATPFTEPYKITSNINLYYVCYAKNFLYYKDINGILYRVEFPSINKKSKSDDENSILSNIKKYKVSDYVDEFIVDSSGKNVAFIDNNSNFYISFDGSEKIKVDNNIELYYFVYDALIYLKDNKLYEYKNSEKSNKLIASDIESVANNYNKNILYYVTKNGEIYLYDSKEKKIFLKNCVDYNNIVAENQCIYEEKLSINDIIGCYSNFDDENNYIIKIDNEKITYYNDYYDKITYYVNCTYSDSSYLELSTDDDMICSISTMGDNIYIDLYDDSWFSGYLEKISNKEYEELVSQYEETNQLCNMAYEYINNGYTELDEKQLYNSCDFSDTTEYTTIKGNCYSVYDFVIDKNNNLWLQLICYDGEEDIYLWLCCQNMI